MQVKTVRKMSWVMGITIGSALFVLSFIPYPTTSPIIILGHFLASFVLGIVAGWMTYDIVSWIISRKNL